MPTRPLERLLFAQGGLCFFCKKQLPLADASVEHLVASANGGTNGDQNCVVCCKALNALLGSRSLKEKIDVVLSQKGAFKCPNRPTKSSAKQQTDALAIVIEDLRQRGSAKPKTVRKLTNTIGSMLVQKGIIAADAESLLRQLAAKGVIGITGNKISYPPSDE